MIRDWKEQNSVQICEKSEYDIIVPGYLPISDHNKMNTSINNHKIRVCRVPCLFYRTLLLEQTGIGQ